MDSIAALFGEGWSVMQRKVKLALSSVSFNQDWAAYRDGFGSATGNDNYWLGLNKVYRLVQRGIASLRVEVCKFRVVYYVVDYYCCVKICL